MNYSSKILLYCFFGLVILSMGFSYYVFIIKQDFTIFLSEDEMPNQTDISSILNL